ncbi:hypothetical protein AVEN_120874-1 [Araneus ventricosus]|uniref:Uncharacterized protein n=1 Tax=Araneus ventricosus TaxID=182803 RepID=A0A4Y2C6U4_ARAVE|nr:hypothetical protein AVEN_120874-1 [Araneus ventricosus]
MCPKKCVTPHSGSVADRTDLPRSQQAANLQERLKEGPPPSGQALTGFNGLPSLTFVGKFATGVSSLSGVCTRTVKPTVRCRCQVRTETCRVPVKTFMILRMRHLLLSVLLFACKPRFSVTAKFAEGTLTTTRSNNDSSSITLFQTKSCTLLFFPFYFYLSSHYRICFEGN